MMNNFDKHYLVKQDTELLKELVDRLNEQQIITLNDLMWYLDKHQISSFGELEDYLSSFGVDSQISRLSKLLFERLRLAKSARIESFVSSKQVAAYLHAYFLGHSQEQLVAIYLNNKNQVIAQKIIFQGTVTQAPAYPREILRWALIYDATAVIVAHNHPSGDYTPSPNDIRFTEVLAQACGQVGIDLLDHFVVAKSNYTSFMENELLKK